MITLRYWSIAAVGLAVLGWRTAAADWAALFGRAVLYLLILAIFSQIWRVTPFDEIAGRHISAAQLVWYMAITELVIFASGVLYREVELDISNGDFIIRVISPFPYGALVLMRWIGATICRLLFLACVGLPAAYFLTNAFPFTARTAVLLLLSTMLASLSVLLFQLMIGYAATWLGPANPVFWVWQKMTFVLGGLIVPLQLYPEPWHGIAIASPFAGLLAIPGSFAFTPEEQHFGNPLAIQVAWLVVISVLTIVVDRVATKQLLTRGA